MNRQKFESLVAYIVSRSVELKNQYTDEVDAKVEFADIFAKDDEEFQQLTATISKLGKIVFPGPTGDIYMLQQPIKTVAGDLCLVKVRKPDKALWLRGDADFDTDYPRLLEKHKNGSRFEHIVREKFEMLRLSDPSFDVMSCFSNIPVRKWI